MCLSLSTKAGDWRSRSRLGNWFGLIADEMEKLTEEEKKLKIRDIQSIDFGTNLVEIISSLEILLVLFTHDDVDIEEECKAKLEEGFELLKKWGEENEVDLF